MSSSIVKDIFSKGFASVREDDMLSSCFSLFKEEMPPVLVVLDPSRTKVKTLMRPAPKVTLESAISKTARLMVESGIRQLPVPSIPVKGNDKASHRCFT